MLDNVASEIRISQAKFAYRISLEHIYSFKYHLTSVNYSLQV